MKTKLLLTNLILSAFTHAQIEPIEVADLHLRITAASTKSLYYAFEKGDRITFDLKEGKGKKLREFQIIEYPDRPIYSDYKTKGFKKEISITKRGVYQIKMQNSKWLSSREVDLHISRRPKSKETEHFNTSIEWQTVYDTTYNIYEKSIVVGYDTVLQNLTRKVLVKIDTIATSILDRVERVHSRTAIDKVNRNIVRVILPPKQESYLLTKEVISWAYWIGAGNESKEAYKESTIELGKTLVSAAASYFGLGPLGPLAVEGVAHFTVPKVGNSVLFYWVHDYNNAVAFLNSQPFHQFSHGNSVAAYGRYTAPLQGEFYLGLQNDNFIEGINVEVKVVVAQLVKTFENRNYTVPKAIPIRESKIFKDPIITKRDIPTINTQP